MADEVARLRWQCRRGMKELDQLLTRYLETRYRAAGDTERADFKAILTLPDPELAAYFLGRQVPEKADIARAVERILELS